MKPTSKDRSAAGRPDRARRRTLGILIAPPLAALTGACGQLVPGQGPPPVLYRLTPKSTFSPDLPVVKWQLVLEQPLANAALSGTRIALWPNPTGHRTWSRP